MHADILILGAGVVGASVACHLAERGAGNVLVIDRAPAFGGGSTARATGGFRAQFDNETEVRLSLLSRQKLLSFEELTGVDSGYRPFGYLFLACGEGELAALRDAQRVQHACGVREAHMISAAEARQLNPAIEDDCVIGAAYCPTDGFLRPMNILQGYAARAERLGVRFLFDTTVIELLEDGTGITGARTSRGDVRAGLVVNAMGAWSGAPVVAVRRNVAATVATAALPESTPMTIWSGDWYHMRVRDGRVLQLWPDDPCVDDWLEQVQRKTAARMPRLAPIPIEECWSGFYEMTPDGRAMVGRSPRFENLYLATGCSGHGVMHAPAIGQLLAELIVDGSASIDISALDPRRF